MAVNIAVLVLAAFITYMWVIRGFFSALIHLVCTIIAGTLAFAFWEPVSYWLLDASPTSGFFSFLQGMSFAVGLLVPFAVILLILRLVVDKLLPANVVLTAKFNYIGGGVCGLLAGVLSGGILAIGMSFYRAGDEFGNPVAFTNGSWVRNKSMWIPLDKYTGEFFGMLSERAFNSDESLAKWHPEVHEEGGAMHHTAFEGKDRNSMRLDDATVEAVFTVGDGKGKLTDLLQDRWHVGTQKASDMDGKAWPTNSKIVGYLVKFRPGAKEKDGKVAIGGSQARLLLERIEEGGDGPERMSVFPLAVSSKTAPVATVTSGNASGNAPPPVQKGEEFGRWWFASGEDFIGSVGGAADALFGFEFVCPPGYRPLGLYIKGVRYNVGPDGPKLKEVKFMGRSDRDGAIASGFTSTGVALTTVKTLDESESIKATYQTGEGQKGQPPFGLRITNRTPFTIQKGNHDQLELDEEHDKNIILTGEATLPLDAMQNRGLEKPIRIEQFLQVPDQAMVQIDAGASSPFSVMSKVFINQDKNSPPALYDAQNNIYIPVGYIYIDETKVVVSFKPGDPITSMDKLPKMSASRPAQKLTLLYRVTWGVNLKAYGVNTGDGTAKAAVVIDPSFPLQQTR